MAKTCEYCGNFFSKGFEMEGQTPTDDDRFCSEECHCEFEGVLNESWLEGPQEDWGRDE